MSVFREITITWKGREYPIQPSLKTLRTLEMMKISVFSVAENVQSGSYPFASIATIAGVLLRSAGVDVSDDEIFSEIRKTLRNGNAQPVVEMMAAILIAFSPAEEDKGNPVAQTERQSKVRAKLKTAS